MKPSIALWIPVARASGVRRVRPAALHVTDDTGRHLRYTSRAKREADVSLSHPDPWNSHAAPVSPRQMAFRTPAERKWNSRVRGPKKNLPPGTTKPLARQCSLVAIT